MEEQIKLVAERIKEMRNILKLSIDEVAKGLDISAQVYEGYESGTVDIPVGILIKLAKRYKIELSTLITGDAPRLHTFEVTRKDSGVSVERRQDYKYQSLAYNFIHKKAEPFLVTVAPEPAETPVHFNNHPGQEFNYVLEGTLKVVIGKNEIILNEGDSLYFDSNVGHGMKAINGKQASFLAIVF